MADDKVIISRSKITAIADAVRAKTGKSDLISLGNIPSEINGISSGGSGASTPIDNGPIYEGKYRVRYFDTDGTILKIEYVESGGKTTPPDNPSYDPEYLIFAEWNYDTDNYIVEQPTDIGAIYDTVDDATYMFCRFTTNTGLNPTLGIYSFTSIDWGDGTINAKKSHTYANEGEYIIKIYGDISIDASSNILGGLTLNSALQKYYIKNSVTSIGEKAFASCYSLTNITIPKSVISIDNYTFNNCTSLRSITIPEGVTSIGDRAFNYCYSLTNITIPKSVISIGNAAFFNCYNLTNIIIPDGVPSIINNTFHQCYSLTSITIPKSIALIGTYAFRSCYSVTNYFIECDTVPTLSNTDAFQNINPLAIFWINDSIIEQLKVATNWSNSATMMKPLSWYPSLTDPNA
jgi:hypothetical protein